MCMWLCVFQSFIEELWNERLKLCVYAIFLTSSMASCILALRGTREHTTLSSQYRKSTTEERQPRTRSHWIMQTANT